MGAFSDSPPDHVANFRPRLVAPLMTLGTIGLMELSGRVFHAMPTSPSPIFLLVLSCGAFISGLRAGMISAVMVLVYMGFFFHGLYGPWLRSLDFANFNRMLLLSVVAPGIVLIIGLLKRRLLAVERAQAASQRREAEEFLRLTTETVGIGIFSYDPSDGGKLTVSPQYRKNCGLPADLPFDFPTLLGRVIIPEDRDRVRQAVEAALAPGSSGVYDIEYRIRRLNDGAERWMSVRGRAQTAPGSQVRTMSGATIDITDKFHAQEERERLLASERRTNQELERANRLKDEFLATLSHELRTPLNAILGWVHILKTDLGNPDTEKSALEVIERNGRAQLQLIEDLLDVSRIINGKMTLKTRPVVLEEVVRAALETVRPTAQARSIRLESSFDPATGEVVGDPDRLQQVVWNLLSNAMKFTPQGGQVEVRLERVGSTARIVVHDSGQGIAAEFLPHLFERFRQADSSSTRAHSGLGIGLALVRHLVELHGGSVEAASPGAGQGATFIVNLPLAANRQDTAQASAAASASPGGEDAPAGRRSGALGGVRILTVDDDADTRELLRTILSAHGAAVTTATNVAEGIDALRRERPQVLLCDIEMPQEDGYGMIGRVRRLAAAEGGAIPAVALTAYARKEDEQRALAAGFQRHMPKPVQPRELVLALAGLVGRPVDAATFKA